MSTLFRRDGPFLPLLSLSHLCSFSCFFFLPPLASDGTECQLLNSHFFKTVLDAVNSVSRQVYDKRIVKLNIYIHLQRRDNILDNEKNRAGPTHSWLFILRDDGPRHFKTLTAWHSPRVLCWGNWLNSSVILILRVSSLCLSKDDECMDFQSQLMPF